LVFFPVFATALAVANGSNPALLASSAAEVAKAVAFSINSATSATS